MPIRRSPNGVHHPVHRLVAIPVTGGRDQSERLVPINRNSWSHSAGARMESLMKF
jgi:hypothetical protein